MKPFSNERKTIVQWKENHFPMKGQPLSMFNSSITTQRLLRARFSFPIVFVYGFKQTMSRSTPNELLLETWAVRHPKNCFRQHFNMSSSAPKELLFQVLFRVFLVEQFGTQRTVCWSISLRAVQHPKKCFWKHFCVSSSAPKEPLDLKQESANTSLKRRSARA